MSRRRALVALAALAIVLVVAFLLAQAGPQPLAPAPTPAGRLPGPVSSDRAIVVEGDWYRLAFTVPRYPDRKEDHQGGLDVLLVDLMNRAQRTLDVADYDFDLANVAQAMADARRRGVRVRMVTDSDTVGDTRNVAIQSALKTLRDADVPIVEDGRPAIMHDKFTIVDGEWLSTGSWNYTDGDTYRLNNWMGIFQSRELAENYTAHFEELFVKKNFAGAGRAPLPHARIQVGGATIRTCFSPNGGCERQIVQTIGDRAQRSIIFMAFSFTSDPIGEAMLAKARSGVRVEGVFETTGSSTAFSEYGRMKAAGLAVLTDGNPYVMHHKVIVLDDAVTLAGSFNFSSNADTDNNENLLIVDDAAIARAFREEYERVRAVAENPPARQ